MTLAIEQEILEKFRQLDHAAQQRVLHRMQSVATQSDFDVAHWREELPTVQIQLRPNPDGTTTSVVDLLNELREERVDEILRSIGLGNTSDNR